MVEDDGNVSTLKNCGGRLRKVDKKRSPEEKGLEKLSENDLYTSTGVLACGFLNESIHKN